jgi:hypothetical protein
MKPSLIASFFAQLRQKYFQWRVNHEIFERMFTHLNGDRNYGYSFENDEQLKAQTELLDVQALLDSIEAQARKMPKAYGQCFRHILHRDLQARLRMYEQIGRKRIHPPTCDPRYVARQA